MGRKKFQCLDANRGHDPIEDEILLLPLFPKGRRGPGRGGSFFSLPLSPALSPLVPSRGEREAKDATLIPRFVDREHLQRWDANRGHEPTPTPPRRGAAKGMSVAHSPLGRGERVGWDRGDSLILCRIPRLSGDSNGS